MPDKLLSKAEVADILNLSVRSIDRLRARGMLPAMKILNAVRFKWEDVQALLDAQRQGVRP